MYMCVSAAGLWCWSLCCHPSCHYRHHRVPLSCQTHTNATLPLKTASSPARDKACRNIKAYLFGNIWGFFLEDDWKRNYWRLSLKWELTSHGSPRENCPFFFFSIKKSSELIYSPHTSPWTGFFFQNHCSVFTPLSSGEAEALRLCCCLFEYKLRAYGENNHVVTSTTPRLRLNLLFVWIWSV